jgi:hypothetical protein
MLKNQFPQKSAALGRPNPRSDVYAALTNPESYGMTLFTAVAQIIDIGELSQMSFDSILMEIEDEVKVDLSDTRNGLRLQAAVSLMFTPSMFYEDVTGFEDICNALSFQDIDPDVYDPAEPDEMAWAIAEAKIMDPPDPNEMRWSTDVRLYMGTALSYFGVPRPPVGMDAAIYPDQSVNPAMLLADEPDLVSAVYELQSSITQQINQSVQEQLRVLYSQLQVFSKE